MQALAVDALVDQLEAFRATGEELAALQALARLADIPKADWPRLAERAAASRLTAALTAFADVAAGVAAGRVPVPDADAWHALWLDLR